MAEEPINPDPARPAPGTADDRLGLDEASASLSDALRTSFRVLTFIIVLLLALFVAQGFFTVQSDQKAIVLRFGAYEEGCVKDVGIHYAFPYPIDRIVPIWVKTRSLSVNTFWSRATEQAKKEKMEKGSEMAPPVEGAEDAYMLTGDMNILQAQWDVTYRIGQGEQAVMDYYRNIGEGVASPADANKIPPNEVPLLVAAIQNKVPLNEVLLVATALQNAAIRETGRMKVFDIYPNGKDMLVEAVKADLAQTLRDLHCGLEVNLLTLRELRPPENVQGAFDQVLAATQAMASLRVSAESERKRMLIETAGEVGVDLGDDIQKWWAAKDAGNAVEQARVEDQMEQTFKSVKSGQVYTVLKDAEAYSARVVSSAKGDSSTMESLLQNPDRIKVFLDHERVDALEKVFDACYEKYCYNQAGDGSRRLLELWLGRRPELLRAATRPESQ